MPSRGVRDRSPPGLLARKAGGGIQSVEEAERDKPRRASKPHRGRPCMRLTILFVSLLQLLEQHPVEDGRGRPLNRRCVTTSRAGSGCSGELAEPIELITELWVDPGARIQG